MKHTFFRLLALVMIAATVLAGCGTEGTQTPAASGGEKVTITWWHITTAENQKAVWQKLADEYMAAHPNVTIEITVLENEAFKTKLTTVMQSGSPPDIFQSWGGGTMNQYAE
ncbi:MAG TPA: extracellular solute-binding protein, partial [Anaerolineae bacterium]|nr:extracellular solute-binding protein [Anaerolineae bacterium]